MDGSYRTTNTHSRWIAGGVAAIVLTGCMLTFAGGVWLLSRPARTVQSARPINDREVAVVQPVATPAPLVVIATPEGGRDYETSVLANIYATVNPAVVNVTVLGAGGMPQDENHPSDEGQSEILPFSSGSGFVWDTEGHIITNNHVVEGAGEVQITFSDGTAAVAELIGVDPDSDLAVLRIDPEGYELHPIRVGDLSNVYVGMRVAAIGNPFGLEGTLTTGIVSAIGRSIPARGNFSIPDSIQTDAAINPGNSGGPLVNEQGELIGVNAQIRSDVRANSGVGFAIPVNVVQRVAPAIISDGKFEHSYMGVSGGTLSPICAEDLGVPKTLRGAIVSQVLARTPASKAGLQGGERDTNTRYPSICPQQAGGDVIVAIEGQPVIRFDDVLAYLQRYTSPGDTITLTIWRDGEQLDMDLTLEARPE